MQTEVEEEVLTQPLENSEDIIQENDTGDIVKCAKLFPLQGNQPVIVLSKSTHSFGRGQTCDHSLNLILPDKQRLNCSTVHFIISMKETTVRGTLFESYEICDMSRNGTFVNERRVNGKQIIVDGDRISILRPQNRVFVFVEPSQENSHFPKELLEKYVITNRRLGSGASGDVRLIFEKGTTRQFALKVIKLSDDSDDSTCMNCEEFINRELEIADIVSHPCIIQINDTFTQEDGAYLVMEVAEGGSLIDHILDDGAFPEDVAKLYCYQMLRAVEYMHNNSIVHRDLKPDNILMLDESKETLIKVTDFGLSRLLESQVSLKSVVGTPHYMAPEVAFGGGRLNYSMACDVWSLGVIFFMCLTGEDVHLIKRQDTTFIMQMEVTTALTRHSKWRSLSMEARWVLTQMLNVDPVHRLTIAQALNSRWMRDSTMRRKAHQLMYPNGTIPIEYCTNVKENHVPQHQSVYVIDDKRCSPTYKRTRLLDGSAVNSTPKQ